jgi:TRAP transporter T-component
VPLLYWSAASLGGAIALAKGRADLVVDLPVVRAMLARALVLDEGWSNGSLHELTITIEGLGKALGGSEARARQHFERPHRGPAIDPSAAPRPAPGCWRSPPLTARRFRRTPPSLEASAIREMRDSTKTATQRGTLVPADVFDAAMQERTTFRQGPRN